MRSPRTQRRRTAAGPVRLGRLADACLDPVVRRYGFGSAGIIAAWPEIVGPELAARTRPERIRWPRRRDDGHGEAATLTVRAEGGDALELQHMAGIVTERINAFFGWRAVGRLAIRQGPVAAAGEPHAAPRETKPLRPESEVAVQGIDDPGLRAALRALGRTVRDPDK